MLCNYYLILCYISCQHHIKTHRRGLKAIVNPMQTNTTMQTKKREDARTHPLNRCIYGVTYHPHYMFHHSIQRR